MTHPPTGRFWAVGVGPGDPELLTVKAVELLRRADVVYHAGPADDRGRALDVVREHIRTETPTRTVLSASMAEATADNGKAPYRLGVERIAADCRAGRDVVLVTEGDPTVYSTAAVVWRLLHEAAPEVPIEVVPGISSITAAAARLRWSLAQKDETLAVVPAGYHNDRLAEWLADFDTVCLLKPSQVLPQVLEAIDELGPGRQAAYLENIGSAAEFVTHDLGEAAGRKNYFSLVLVRRSPQVAKTTAGKVWVVGLGPGDPDMLTRRALAILQSADALVGYESYLQGLTALRLRGETHAFPIGAEAERATRTLELARQGKNVALVSSGDAGVYGMASLLLETAERCPDVEVELVPGVTAAMSAAALLGAPLGHDFACVSLSDLLTPWEVIEKRLHAAGQADYVLALYNPISKRRTWQLPRTRDILLCYRRPETPVGLVERAFRPGTRITLTTLGELKPDGITMETLLIVGNSQTRRSGNRLITPRGYPLTDDIGSPPPQSPSVPPIGREIMAESFRIIDRELGEPPLPAWARAVVRRMIHASADFDFARLLRYSEDFEPALRQALQHPGLAIVTDTEMLLVGLRAVLAERGQTVTTHCHLNDEETRDVASRTGLTRSAAGIRVAARQHPQPLVVIGNAPTALDETLRLVEGEGWRPVAIIGMPVGFVGVEEAKSRLVQQQRVPFLTCLGRKGGTAVTAAAVNALFAWDGSP